MQKMFGILLKKKVWKTIINGTWKAILFYFKVFSKNLEICLKTYDIDLLHFYFAQRLTWLATLKKTEIRLEPQVHVDMLLMIEKQIRGGICHKILRHAKVYNNYLKKN